MKTSLTPNISFDFLLSTMCEARSYNTEEQEEITEREHTHRETGRENTEREQRDRSYIANARFPYKLYESPVLCQSTS